MAGFTASGISTLSNTVYVTSTAANNGNATSGALQVSGGVGISENLFVGGASGITVATAVTNTVVPIVYSNNVLLASYTSGVISGSSPVNLDSYSTSTYRTARYTIQAVDGTNVHVTEMTVFHDGLGNTYLNEYGISYNNGSLGTFSATVTSNNVVLSFTPVSATAMTIKVVRLGITL